MKTTTMIKSLMIAVMMCMTTSMMAKTTAKANYDKRTNCTECRMEAQKYDKHHNKGHLMDCRCMEQMTKHCHSSKCKCNCHKTSVQTCNRNKGQNNHNTNLNKGQSSNHNTNLNKGQNNHNTNLNKGQSSNHNTNHQTSSNAKGGRR